MGMYEKLQLCCIFVALITGSCAQQPSLEIQPNQRVVTKEVDGSLALTCRPNVPDPSLVTQLEWRDPLDRRIDTTNRASPIYVQNLPGEPGAVLIFSKLTQNQGGKYSCHAFYANTEPLTASIELNVYIDINFIDAPENQYPVVGKDFPVKCKVKGNPAPIIEWNKNGDIISTNEKYVIAPDQLLIKNVTEADDGVYKCMAIEVTTGQFKTRNIKVEVQVPPRIEAMDTITIIEGETASAKCSATGKPPPTYQWIKLKDRQDLSVTDRFDVKKNTGELIMNRVEFNDDGIYKCIAENSVDRVETTVKINVLVKPKIYELINITAPIRGQAEIVCKAYGRPPPRIVFRKLSRHEQFRVGQQLDDRRITLEQQFFQEKGESYGTLIISNLSRIDDGLYECIAENTAETAYKNGHIAIEFPPTFERTKDLPPVWSWDNKPGNLSCLPEAIPNATIVWKYGGIEIPDGPNFQKIGNGPSSFLIVKPYNDKRLFTQYECIASNKLGQASIKLMLKQAFVPGPVSQAKAEHQTATTIKFSIIPANNFDGLPLRSYTVRYKPERELSWDYARNHTWSYGAPYILENLTPEETYHFQFAARNDVGMGAFQNAGSVTMPRRSVPAEPKILMESHSVRDENSSNREDTIALSPYADHFELRWGVPNDNGEPIQYYLVRYCVTEKISGEWHDKDCSEQDQQSVKYTNYQLGNLRPDTVYKIELRARNAIGDSSPAQIKVRTARGVDPIVPVQTAAMSSSTIIGIVVGAIIIVLIVLDITCYFVNRLGIIAMCCRARAKNADEEDPKLGREEREPLKGEEKQMSVEFDGRFVHSKSGEIIGKHSAV